MDDNQAPKVSVIIPTYNRASYLKEAVQSVLDQTYRNFELIIVDDGSTDNTEEVVASFTDDRIRYIKKNNEGHAGKTRNVGLENARGEYIAFLDDDDVWLPEKLELQIKTMMEHPEFKASYTLYSIVGTGEQRKIHMHPKQNLQQGNIFNDLIKYGAIVCTPSICLHKDVIKKVGKFAEIPELRSGQDYDLWLRIAHVFDFICIPRELVIVRFHSGSVSETYLTTKFLTIYDRVIKDSNAPKGLKRKFLSNAYFIEGEVSLLQNDSRFRESFLKSLTINPFTLRSYLVIPLLIMPVNLAKKTYIQLKYLQRKIMNR